MPRVSRAQATAHHHAIEAAASRLFRERGVEAVTVAEVMADVGLTHGGFYAHFPSKDALAASACRAAFQQSAAKWDARVAAAPDEAGRTISEGYLRAANADPTIATCPTATLAADVARAGASHPIRAAYIAGVRRQIETLASLGTSGRAVEDRANACVWLATMMGALLLARATHGDAVCGEILDAARARLAAERSRPSAPRRARSGAGARRARTSRKGGVR